MLDRTLENEVEIKEEDFIKDLIDNYKQVTVFLISGIKLEGTITYKDGYRSWSFAAALAKVGIM